MKSAPPLILADIPGLVAGAATGKGLGQRFLRHLHWTRLLLHVVDSTQLDPDRPLAPIDVVLEELRLFEPGLLRRPQVVVFNKTDLLPGEFPWGRILAACEARGWPAVAVSAQTGEGLAALQDLLWNQIDALPHADIG